MLIESHDSCYDYNNQRTHASTIRQVLPGVRCESDHSSMNYTSVVQGHYRQDRKLDAFTYYGVAES